MTNALENHIPYLMRPMSEAQIADWVVKQAPQEHGIETRHMFSNLSAEDKKCGHKVASAISDIIANAVDPAAQLREHLKLAGGPEFVGIADDSGGRRQSRSRAPACGANQLGEVRDVAWATPQWRNASTLTAPTLDLGDLELGYLEFGA